MGGVMYRFFTELMVDVGRARGWPVEQLPLGPTGPAPDPLYEAMDRGELTEPQYANALVEALARRGIAFLPHRDLELSAAERPETWAAIARLRKAGFRQVILTNDATRWLGERWWETWPRRAWFDAIVDVATLGVRKPAPAPYLACSRALGVEPAQCLFVDDLRVNCRGAEAAGMESFWFQVAEPQASAAELLRRLGL
jgi:FMN phosphatase YigB (HAD superfamily)